MKAPKTAISALHGGGRRSASAPTLTCGAANVTPLINVAMTADEFLASHCAYT